MINLQSVLNVEKIGYFLKPEMVNVSFSTMKRFGQRTTLLYEQGADNVRIGEYVEH